MMIKSGDAETKRPVSNPRLGRIGTVSTLKRIGTYLWIGIINPGPPPLPDIKGKSKVEARNK